MVNSFVAKKDLDSEMTVVRNEFESGENEPSSVLQERVLETAYLWHNYGHPTIGARSDIERVPIERLQAFYRRHYQPDNCILTVAGKFDEAKTLALITKYFGPLPRPTRVLTPSYTEEPTQDGERTVVLRRVGDTQSAVAAYHIPAGASTDFPAIDVLSDVLNNNPSGRLYKALVETGKATAVGGGTYQMLEPGLLVTGISMRKDGDLKSAVDIMLDLVENFAKTPPTSVEVERAKTSMLSSMELTLNSSESFALQLSDWAAMGDWRLFFLYRDRLQKVTPDDVTRVAKEYLVASNRTLGEFIPTADPVRAKIPWMTDPSAEVKNYQGHATVASGEAFDPTPENCDKRDVRKKLAGGLESSMFVKKTRGQMVYLDMVLRLGANADDFNQGDAPDAVADMLNRGTKKHTRTQIADALDRLKAEVSFESSAGYCSVALSTVRANLPETLNLVAEMLREPAFDPKEFATWKQAALQGIEEERNDPATLARIDLGRHMTPYPMGDPRHVNNVDESLAQLNSLTLDQVKAYYARVYGASAGQVSAVGDFDPAELEKQLNSLLSDWKSPGPFERLKGKYFDVSAANDTLVVKDKANASVLVQENLDLTDTDPDYPALVLGNYIFGGGFLNSRLATRIRQKEGLSYGIGSHIGAQTLDPVASFGMNAICAPQNAHKVEVAMKEELARVLKDGFTADELEKAKSGILQQREGGRSSNQSVVGSLIRYQYIGRRFTWDRKFDDTLKALTPAQVLAAMRKHINPDKLSFVRAGDLPGATNSTTP